MTKEHSWVSEHAGGVGRRQLLRPQACAAAGPSCQESARLAGATESFVRGDDSSLCTSLFICCTISSLCPPLSLLASGQVLASLSPLWVRTPSRTLAVEFTACLLQATVGVVRATTSTWALADQQHCPSWLLHQLVAGERAWQVRAGVGARGLEGRPGLTFRKSIES